MKNKAFTLVELLVVVLILGILAAIAVPQYQKSVIKSRLSELDVVFAATRQGVDLYLLQKGFPQTETLFTGTAANKGLSVTIPGTPCARYLNCVDKLGGYDIGCSSIHCGVTLRTNVYTDGKQVVNLAWLGGSGGNVGLEYMPQTGWALVNVPDDLTARKIVCEWWKGKGKIIDSPRYSYYYAGTSAKTKCAQVGI